LNFTALELIPLMLLEYARLTTPRHLYNHLYQMMGDAYIKRGWEDGFEVARSVDKTTTRP